MRFTVESWSPDYGAPLESMGDEEEGRRGSVDAFVEKPLSEWQPLSTDAPPAATVLFVDGVQRIDARVWVSQDSVSRMGLCVSLAAGVVRCDGAATIEDVRVSRAYLGQPGMQTIECEGGVSYRAVPVAGSTQNDLSQAVGQRRDELEMDVAVHADGGDLVVVDGRLRGRESIENAIGLLKTHQQQYLDPNLARVVGQLGAGQRTPAFLASSPLGYTRYSWYLRLPGGQGHDWAGIVRCEASSSLSMAEVRRLADRSAATLPRFASDPYKDPRAPQNLYPVGGLERDLRRHLGDPIWLLRQLQRAGHNSS